MTEAGAARQRLLVTGVGGFVGEHGRKAIGACEVVPYAWHAAPEGFDVRRRDEVDALVAQVRPDAVLHLAAQSFVPQSFKDPAGTFEVNVLGTLHLLQALTRSGFRGRFLYVSSGDVYGLVPDELLPVDERRWPEPRNPYASSKIAAETLVLQWHRAQGLDAMVVRPFNHIGPGQRKDFAIPAFAQQIVAIADGRQAPVLDVGDIDTTRDFLDVRDVVRGYAALFAHGQAGATYVLGSGVERRIRDMIGFMCAACGVDPEIRQDPSRLRPSEQRRMVADAGLMRAHTGWSPRYTIEQTLHDVLEDARGIA